jgi:hypothetical protein
LAILAKISTESEACSETWAVSAFTHFQRLKGAENGGTSLCRGNRDEISGSSGVGPNGDDCI